MKAKGYVIYEGLSPIDQQPIVAIATLKTSNRKTGNMVQVWILRADVSPVDAISDGSDRSICGDCPHRKQSSTGRRTCYVNVGQAPLAVWRAYKRGAYDKVESPQAVADLFKDRGIRWGAYGDPGILPIGVISNYNSLVQFHTGYTHQWRHGFTHDKIGVFQASTDGLLDHLEASTLGWKTFTVVKKHEQPTYAKQCPATVENSQAQCITCSLCNGARSDIFVHAHGPSANFV